MTYERADFEAAMTYHTDTIQNIEAILDENAEQYAD